MNGWTTYKLHKELIVCCKHGKWDEIVWDAIKNNAKYKNMNTCINPIDIESTLKDILEKVNEQIS